MTLPYLSGPRRSHPRGCLQMLLGQMLLCLLLVIGLPNAARAALQFDVFLGFDGIVPEGSWFPVTIEVKNDGATFTGTIEVADAFGSPDKTSMVVELPTGTLKRVVLPIYSGNQNYRSFNVALRDEKGTIRQQHQGLRPRKSVDVSLPLVCGLSRTVSGVPVLRQRQQSRAEDALPTARIQPAMLPDNPLVLEGVSTFYLNSQRASELTAAQVTALYSWLHMGGQLVIGVEQAGDIEARPWLKELLPCTVGEMITVPTHQELQQWLRRSDSQPEEQSDAAPAPRARHSFTDPDDPAFEIAPMQMHNAKLRNGKVLVEAEGKPLIIEAQRGKGLVTVLLFDPEREPMRSWKNLPSFWAKLSAVPASYYATKESNHRPAFTTDGIFGAMLDTRQVNKLPYHWLLLLLVVYLIVIGPFDMYFLRKINRPMLTWLTFPSYVVLFSLLIYYIGYMLRAGESEWNEIHFVDVYPSGEQAEMRGRTFASVYSPANQRFALQGKQRYAALRTELAGGWQGNAKGPGEEVLITGDNFNGAIYVPVWTSQLLVSDWCQSGPAVLKASVKRNGQELNLTVQNNTGRELTNVQFVKDRLIFSLDKLRPGTSEHALAPEQSRPLWESLQARTYQFQSAVQARQYAFGSQRSGHLDDLPGSSVGVSFLNAARTDPQVPQQNNFFPASGVDLTEALDRGCAFLLAWDEGNSPTKPLHAFTPKRTARHTLWRVLVD